MKFMMFICVDGSRQLPPEERAAIGPGVEAWVQEMERRGVRLQGDVLAPPADAATVRVRQGEMSVSDGPFADTQEHISGFNILDCADLHEAIEVASKHPVASFGTVELRPFRVG